MKIFVLFILIFCTSCTKNSSTTNRKVLNQISDPLTHFDPQKRTDLASSLQLAKIYEPLFEVHPFDSDFRMLPNLASKFPVVSEDGLTYTIKIKEGIFYQDNPCFNTKRELIAEDFVTTFKRIADPKLITPYFSYWLNHIQGLENWYNTNKEKEVVDYTLPLEGIKAVGKYTLEIKIINRNLDFIKLLGSTVTAPIPIEAIQYYKNDLSQSTIGTGPFILKSYARKSRIVFVRNTKYRDKFFPKTSSPEYAHFVKEYGGRKLPLLDAITVHVISESQTGWLNFMRDKIDYLEVPKDNFSETFISQQKLTPEMEKRGIRVGQTPAQTNIFYFGLNNKDPILSKKKVRQAMAMALDENRYNELFHHGAAEVAHSILPPNIEGNKPNLESPFIGANISEAKKLLKEAGHENGLGIPEILITVKAKTTSRQAGEFLKNQMSKIGIKMKVETVAWPRLLSKIQKGDYQVFYLAWFTGFPSAFEFFELIYGPNYPDSFNRLGYQNKTFDELLVKSKSMTNLSERNNIIRKMNKIFLEDLPFLPLVHTKDYFIRHSRLKNYVPSNQMGGLEQYFDIVKD